LTRCLRLGIAVGSSQRQYIQKKHYTTDGSSKNATKPQCTNSFKQEDYKKLGEKKRKNELENWKFKFIITVPESLWLFTSIITIALT
jgi:hypothetical protein